MSSMSGSSSQSSAGPMRDWGFGALGWWPPKCAKGEAHLPRGSPSALLATTMLQVFALVAPEDLRVRGAALGVVEVVSRMIPRT